MQKSSNLAENSKFTYYCQDQLLQLHFYNYTFSPQFEGGMVLYQAAQLHYE